MSNSKCTISAFLKHSTDVWGGLKSRNNKFKNGNKNKTKSLIGPIGSFQNQFKPIFPSKSEEYQIENPKLQNMMQ